MRALLIYNSESGKKRIKDKIDYICTYLKNIYDYLDKYELNKQSNVLEFLTINGDSYDVVIAAGGDGTIHLVINAIMRLSKRPSLAIIPFGTCNDLANTLGYSKNLNKCLNIIKENKMVAMDASKINDQYFIYGLAAGSLTEISYKAPQTTKKIFGKLAYYFYVLKAFNRKNNLDIRMYFNDEVIADKYSVVIAINTRYLAGFKLKNLKNIHLNDGKLLLVLIKNRNKLINLLSVIKLFLFGKYKSKNIRYLYSDGFKIESDYPIAYNTDGEFLANESRIEVNVIKEGINVILNEKIINKYFKV